MLLAIANRVNSVGEYEKPFQEQISQLIELADNPQLRDLLVCELENPRWKEEFERYEHALVEFGEDI